MVPLDWRDVKPGDYLRDSVYHDAKTVWMVLTVTRYGVIVAQEDEPSPVLGFFAFENWKQYPEREISHDFGATWTRCEKAAKEEA